MSEFKVTLQNLYVKEMFFIKLIFCYCFDETKLHLNAFNHISKRINCDVVVNPLFMNSNSNMNELSLGNSNLFVSFTGFFQIVPITVPVSLVINCTHSDTYRL